MARWQISKYPRTLRRPHSQSMADWTAASDIGGVFDERILTLADYLAMEDRYIDVALRFVQESGQDMLQVQDFEDHGAPTAKMESLGLAQLLHEGLPLEEGRWLQGQEIARACRLNLRELIWCRLRGSADFMLDFGYDYYVYITCGAAGAAAATYGKEKGLYVNLVSPR